GEKNAAANGDTVRDLHEVVDLGPFTDARLAHRRSVDGRIRTDLDVVFDDDAGVLRDLEVRAVGLLHETEPVAADHGAVLHDNAIAEHHPFANRRVGIQNAVLTNRGARAD